MFLSERMWGFLGAFFTLTIIVGGLTMAYYGERGQLGVIMDNTVLKLGVILYCMIGVFFIIFTEVRKRVEAGNTKKVGITIGIIIFVFGILALTRL